MLLDVVQKSIGTLSYQEWGAGDPVVALHPLALESGAFAGVAQALERQGLRTLAVDLPGFGKSPAPDEPLTPACLAAPVIDLARSLERPPLLVGMSMGGRVALEAALTHPELFRGVVPVATFLPWREWRSALGSARLLNPRWGGYLPLERAWPVLKYVADWLESWPDLEHDWLARASVRVVYTSSCPASREAFLSAAREMALDPATLWDRLADLAVPATFLWAGRDALIPDSHQQSVAEVLPSADQLEVPCSGHFVSGAHYRCMRHAIAMAVERTLLAGDTAVDARPETGARVLSSCLADQRAIEDEPAASPPPLVQRNAEETGR
jgi:pimeloyl-ACP methyl ester carboxylesterase